MSTASSPPESRHGSAPASPRQTTGTISPEGRRPPLPPRPSELLIMHNRSSPNPGGYRIYGNRSGTRGSLLSRTTTAVSMTDVNTHTNTDGSRQFSTSTPTTVPSSYTVNKLESGRASEADTLSIRSYAASVRAAPEVESLFGDGIARVDDTRSVNQHEYGMMDHGGQTDVDFSTEFDELPEKDGEEATMIAWKAKMKHFFILSAAGKPIYTRHGSDSIISSYVGIIQTIISFYQSSSDPLRSFSAGNAKFVVLSQTNLFLFAISSLHESDAQLRAQLDALYMQILSTLTLPTLTHIFSLRPSSDLRRPLQGTEVLLSSLADRFTRGSPSALLSALECLKIRKSHRQVINTTLLKARVNDLLYGLIVAGGRLVSVIRPKKHSLHPGDLQLIFNMLFEAESVKAGGGDSWIPVCLPGFNNKGYLYMYVSFLDLHDENIHEVNEGEEIAKEDAVAIILLSANKEGFEDMQSMKNYLVRELGRNRSLLIIQSAVRGGRPLPTDIVPGTVIRHFLYKSKGNVQFCMPSYTPNYETLDQRRRLLSIYHDLHASVHTKHAAVKIHHSVSPSAASLAWITPMFEIYCVAAPHTSRTVLAQSANKVVQWVQREEERIFIIGGAVF